MTKEIPIHLPSQASNCVLGTSEQFEYFDKANALSSLISQEKSESYIQRPRMKTDWEQVLHQVKSGGVRHDPQRLKGLKRKRLKGLKACLLWKVHLACPASLEALQSNIYTWRNNVFSYFVNSTETRSCLYPSLFRPAETWWSSFPWTGGVSVMFPRRKRTIMFPRHFCYHISVLSCFRYVSGEK